MLRRLLSTRRAPNRASSARTSRPEELRKLRARRPRRSRGTRALALLLALAGCGEPDATSGIESTTGSASSFQRLTLAPETPGEPQETVRTGTLTIPADVEPWSVEPGSATPLPRAGRTVLRVEGPKRHEVRIPGTFDPQTFNRLALALRTSEPLTVRLVFFADGERTLSSTNNLFVPASDETQVVLFDLARARHVEGTLDLLAIQMVDALVPWELEGIELFQRPLVEFLPQPTDGPGLIDSIHVARNGLGLSSETPLIGTVPVVAEGAALTFSYGWPDQVRDPGRSATLTVEVEGQPSTIAEQYELGQGSWGEPNWQTARIDLASFAGEAARIRFTFDAEGPGEALCALAEPAIAAAIPEPRTVLLITSDTHRADHVEGAVRAVEVDTPTLAALARRGTRFENCQSTTNVTLPSHIAIMTATHPRDHGVLTNRATISEGAETLAEAFRDAGFVTWASVSNRYLGRVDTGLGQGFDRIACPQESTDDAETTVERLLSWLPEAEGRPLFCWVHVFDAHTPYAPPKEYLERYGVELVEGQKKRMNPNRALEVDTIRARYRGEITYLDRSLGQLLDQPRFRSGLSALTADHGEGLGEHGIWWTHNGLYPEVVRVPLILAGPGVDPGRRVESAVRHMDLGRTLLDLVGLEGRAFPGTNLFEQGDEGVVRFGLGAHARTASITSSQWHLTLNLVEQPRSAFFPDELFERHAVELYDLSQDPTCEEDLAGVELERAKRLRAELLAWLDSARPTGWGSAGIRDDEVLEQMAELGYTVDAPPSSLAELIDVDCDCEHCARYR